VKLKIVFRYNRRHTQWIAVMTIALKPEQEAFIQTQLTTGRYTDATAVIAEALRLLEKKNHYDEWVEDVRAKIDLAAAQLDRGEGIDGETAIDQLRAKLQEAREK
jgi:antitoxin ParD1/3/4